MSGNTTKTTYNIATPDVDSMTTWNNLLNNSFNKIQLMNIVSTLKPLFDEYEVMQSWMGRIEILNHTFEEINGRTGAKKVDFVGLLTRILADPSNRKTYFSLFSPELKRVWEGIDKNYYLSETQFDELSGMKSTVSNKRSYYYGYSTDQTFIPETGWFTVSSSGSWRQKETVFSLSPSLRKLLLPYFHNRIPDRSAFTETLPQDKNLMVFNGENDIINMLPVLRNMFINDTLQMGKTKIAATSLKNVGKMANLSEFFPETDEKDDQLIRTRMALTLFTLYGTNTLMRSREGAMQMTSHDMVKEIIPHVMYYTHHLTNLILPMLNRILTSFTQFSYVSPIFKEIQTVLVSLGNDNRWVLYDAFEELLRDREVNEMLCTFVKPRLMEENDVSNTRSMKNVTYSTIYRQVGRPFIQGVIFTLASIGIVEIAYTEVDELSPSPYDGLEYLRLTPLGRYALGINETYTTVSKPQNLKYFELSENKLLIRSLGEINPYESLLKDISNPIGNHRYVVTTSSFLKNCFTPINITQKIASFRHFIDNKPPKIWEDFFKGLVSNISKITKCPDVYTIYEIDKSDLKLHEILATDPVIRKITRRAENYLLLIESGKLTLFRERLKVYGYLM